MILKAAYHGKRVSLFFQDIGFVAAREMTGDPETEDGKKLIQESSPLFHADKINKPLMIVQGANDPRVKQAESDQIVEVLKKNGHDVTYLLATDEGHGFRKPLNRLAMHAEVERFFAKHIGGDYQADMADEVSKTLELLTV
jgi:dipeptidyl aminopeptidase/acylaminoacyl peptidase